MNGRNLFRWAALALLTAVIGLSSTACLLVVRDHRHDHHHHDHNRDHNHRHRNHNN